MRITRKLLVLTAALTLGACADSNLQDLNPKLEVEPGTKKDSAGHYLLDFGNVSIGTKDELSILVTDAGRVTLTLRPPAAESPFGAALTTARAVAPSAVVPVAFSFAPTMTST